jgi:hypothetical protein
VRAAGAGSTDAPGRLARRARAPAGTATSYWWMRIAHSNREIPKDTRHPESY